MHCREFLKSAALSGAVVSGWESGKATAAELEAAADVLRKAEFIEPPKLVVPHRPDYEFLGPSIIRVGSNRLLMLASTGKGSHHRSNSDHGGRTWSKPEPTTLIAACSPLTLRRMPDGRLIVFYNHAQPIQPEGFFPRTPLVYAVLSDGGRTWSRSVVIDDQSQRQHIYPAACFLDEGILVVYSTHFSNNTFGATAEQKLIGGGKRCILKYLS